MRIFLVLISLFLSSCSTVPPAENLDRERIVLTTNAEFLRFTVGQSSLELVVPRQGFTPSFLGNGPQGPRYFMISDPARQITISGWFEPSAKFSGAEKLFEYSAPEVRGTLIKNVQMKKVGAWDTVSYDMGEGMTFVRGHWVQAGTWIEVRLSTGRGVSEERLAQLAQILAGLQVREKSQAP